MQPIDPQIDARQLILAGRLAAMLEHRPAVAEAGRIAAVRPSVAAVLRCAARIRTA